MSDTEKFYAALQKYFPEAPPWSKLNLFQQQIFVQGINSILGVMTNGV